MLIKCPECGNEISDKAIRCPKCGFPISAHKEEPAPILSEFEACTHFFMSNYEQCLKSINESFSLLIARDLVPKEEVLTRTLSQMRDASEYKNVVYEVFLPAIERFERLLTSWDEIEINLSKIPSEEEKESCILNFTSKIVELCEKFHNVPEYHVNQISAIGLKLWASCIEILGFNSLAVELKKKVIDYYSFAYVIDYYAKGESVEFFPIIGREYSNGYNKTRMEMNRLAEDINQYDQEFYNSYIHNRDLFNSQMRMVVYGLALVAVGAILAICFHNTAIIFGALVASIILLIRSMASINGYRAIVPGDVSSENIAILIGKNRKN